MSPVCFADQVVLPEIDSQIEAYLKQHHPELEAFCGLNAGLGATMIYQGVANTNADSQTKKDSNGASYSIDITAGKKLKDYGDVFLHLEQGNGDGVEQKIKVFSNVNRDIDPDNNIRATEIWYEGYFSLRSVPLSITFGKMDPSILIDDNKDANDETTKFLGRMFRNSPVIELPDNSLGVRFSASILEFADISFLTIDTFDGMFYAVQTNFKPQFFSKEGNYKLIAWYNGRPHTRWSDATKDSESGYGFGISIDQDLTDSLGVFARYGWQNPKIFLNSNAAFSLWQSYSFGVEQKATFFGRNDDVIGLAFGQIFASKEYKEFYGAASKPETHLEFYYNCKVNDHLFLTPDVQLIANPYGADSGYGDLTVVAAGVRAQFYL